MTSHCRKFADMARFLACLSFGVALAFNAAAEPPARAPQQAQKAPEKPLSHAERIDRLLNDLKNARSEEAAMRVVLRLNQQINSMANPTARLLVERAQQAQRLKQTDIAQNLMETASDLYPRELVVSYYLATILIERNDFSGAMAALETVIRQEPRHVFAWHDLATIMQGLGEEKQALKALQQVETFYPLMPGLKERIRRLSLSVEGVPL